MTDCAVQQGAMTTSRDRDASRSFRFNTAVVCRVASSFGARSSFKDDSTTDADVGIQPHAAECRQELERLVEVLRGALGLDVVELPSDEHQPDGVFVSDIAVVIGGVALICNPPRFSNRPSRHGEVRPSRVSLVAKRRIKPQSFFAISRCLILTCIPIIATVVIRIQVILDISRNTDLLGRVALVRGVAAYSRQTFSLTICWSVGRCVGLSNALWKNGGSDPDTVWRHRSDGVQG